MSRQELEVSYLDLFSSSQRGRCYKCGKTGHLKKNCPNASRFAFDDKMNSHIPASDLPRSRGKDRGRGEPGAGRSREAAARRHRAAKRVRRETRDPDPGIDTNDRNDQHRRANQIRFKPEANPHAATARDVATVAAAAASAANTAAAAAYPAADHDQGIDVSYLVIDSRSNGPVCSESL